MPPFLNRWRSLLFPALALALCLAAWRSYGAQGLLLAVLMISFWVLLHFTKLMRLLRVAAARPLGAVPDVPALQARLRPGMPMHEVIRLTRCLGERADAADGTSAERFAWCDAQGRRVALRFEAGRLAEWTREDGAPPTADNPLAPDRETHPSPPTEP